MTQTQNHPIDCMCDTCYHRCWQSYRTNTTCEGCRILRDEEAAQTAPPDGPCTASSAFGDRPARYTIAWQDHQHRWHAVTVTTEDAAMQQYRTRLDDGLNPSLASSGAQEHAFWQRFDREQEQEVAMNDWRTWPDDAEPSSDCYDPAPSPARRALCIAALALTFSLIPPAGCTITAHWEDGSALATCANDVRMVHDPDGQPVPGIPDNPERGIGWYVVTH